MSAPEIKNRRRVKRMTTKKEEMVGAVTCRMPSTESKTTWRERRKMLAAAAENAFYMEIVEGEHGKLRASSCTKTGQE